MKQNIKMNIVRVSALILCSLFFASCSGDIEVIESIGMNTSVQTKLETSGDLLKDIIILYPNNLDQIKREDKLTKSSRDRMFTSLAKNEAEGMQFVIRCDSEDLVEKSIQVSDLKSEGTRNVISASSVSVYRQHYIYVREPSVVSFPTGYYPDALIPVNEKNTFYIIKKGNNQAYWFTVRTTTETPAGIYTGTVTITFSRGILKIPFTVEVWDFEIPTGNTYQSSYAIWPDMLFEYYGGADQSLYEKYYWFQNQYRIEPSYLPILNSDNTKDYVDQAERFIRDERVSSFNIPFYYRINDDGSIDLMKEKNLQMINLLRERGLIEKGYYYVGGIIDEPRPDQYDRVKAVCALLKEIAPDVPHIVTTRPKAVLSGYVDTWCPLYNEYSEKVAAKYTRNGDGMWWYGCVIPKSPYPNNHIDSSLLCKRLVFWMQKDYNIEGTLYWSTNITKKYSLETDSYGERKVWSDPMAYPGAAGDGYLIYPGKEGDGLVNKNIPVPTIRLEVIRDGVEDLEYLVILEKKVMNLISRLGLEGKLTKDEVMQTIYAQLYSAADEYDDDTERLLKMRSLIAEYILSDLNHLVVITDTDNTGGVCRTGLKIYAAAGFSVSVNDTVLNNPVICGDTAEYTFTLDSNFGENYFTVLCNGKESRYMLNYPEPEKVESEAALIEIDEQTVNEIRQSSPHIKEVSFTEYLNRPAVRIVFDDSEYYPQISIPSSVFTVKDWSAYDSLSLELVCSETNKTTLNLFVILSNQKVSSDEGIINNLFAGEEKEVRIDFDVFKRLEKNYSDIVSVRISSWGDLLRNDGSDGNTTVYITGIKLIKKGK